MTSNLHYHSYSPTLTHQNRTMEPNWQILVREDLEPVRPHVHQIEVPITAFRVGDVSPRRNPHHRRQAGLLRPPALVHVRNACPIGRLFASTQHHDERSGFGYSINDEEKRSLHKKLNSGHCSHRFYLYYRSPLDCRPPQPRSNPLRNILKKESILICILFPFPLNPKPETKPIHL